MRDLQGLIYQAAKDSHNCKTKLQPQLCEMDIILLVAMLYLKNVHIWQMAGGRSASIYIQCKIVQEQSMNTIETSKTEKKKGDADEDEKTSSLIETQKRLKK